MLREEKEPRSIGGKTRKHHWFKNCRVNLLCSLDQKKNEEEARRILESRRTEAYDSVLELFKNSI